MVSKVFMAASNVWWSVEALDFKWHIIWSLKNYTSNVTLYSVWLMVKAQITYLSVTRWWAWSMQNKCNWDNPSWVKIIYTLLVIAPEMAIHTNLVFTESSLHQYDCITASWVSTFTPSHTHTHPYSNWKRRSPFRSISSPRWWSMAELSWRAWTRRQRLSSTWTENYQLSIRGGLNWCHRY